MESNLFKQVAEYLCEDEKLTQMEKELISSLEKQIVQLKYELQKIPVLKTGSPTDNVKYFDVYYPVLQYPITYTKENEVFYTEKNLDVVFHDYTLRDTYERTLKIREKASLYQELKQEEKGILVCNNYVAGNVEYVIKIRDDRQYKFYRKFEEDIADQGEDDLFVLKDNFFDNENTQNENAFRRFLKTIGSTSSITLAEIINSCDSAKEIQLSPIISATFSTKKKKNRGEIWLKNSKLGIKINTWKMCKTTIVIQAYFDFNVKLEKQTYHMWQVENDEELRNGMSFEEAMRLIRSENGE